jgi:lysozyme
MAATTTSALGRSALEDREGVRLEAYLDSVGVLTIGVGHTGRTSPPAVYHGMKITRQQADVFLTLDLAPVEKSVNKITQGRATQNQYDALVSLGFNIGHDKLETSTVARRFASGDVQGAADAFLLWNKPPELVGRRRAERAQFLRPDDTTTPSLTHGLSQVTDVKSLQSVLKKIGFYGGEVDGDFGPKTEKAVRDFQAKRGLVVDGVVGEKTYAALDDETLRAAKSSLSPPAVAEPAAQVTPPAKLPAPPIPEETPGKSLWTMIKEVFRGNK